MSDDLRNDGFSHKDFIADLQSEIGWRLYNKRDGFGWSMEMLAVKAGITKQTVSKIEKGKQMPGLDTAFKLAKALDTDVVSLLFGSAQHTRFSGANYALRAGDGQLREGEASAQEGGRLINDIIRDSEPWEVEYLANRMAFEKQFLQDSNLKPIKKRSRSRK